MKCLILLMVLTFFETGANAQLLDTPSNIRIYASKDDAVILDWDAVDGAGSYAVYRTMQEDINEVNDFDNYSYIGSSSYPHYGDPYALSYHPSYVYYTIVATPDEETIEPGENGASWAAYPPVGIGQYDDDDSSPMDCTFAPSTVARAADGTTPNSRTTVGIGETIALQMSGFSDGDYDRYDGSPVSGDHYSVTFAVSDTSLASVNSAWGTLYIKKLTSPGSVTVYATVHDDGSYWHDEDIVKTKTFNFVLPSSFSFVSFSGIVTPFNSYTFDASGAKIGTKRTFTLQLSPINVSFEDLWIRERIPSSPFSWPIGLTDDFGLTVNDFHVTVNGQRSHDIGIAAKTDKYQLWQLSSLSYVPSSQSYGIVYQYQAESGSWQSFTTSTAYLDYSSTGTVKLKEGSSSWTPEDGPWD